MLLTIQRTSENDRNEKKAVLLRFEILGFEILAKVSRGRETLSYCDPGPITETRGSN